MLETQPPRRAGLEPEGQELEAGPPQAKGKHMELDAHCRRTGCHCDHVVCYRGWIDTVDIVNGREHDVTNPCQYCRPQLHERHWRAQAAKAKGYPGEAVHRILRTTTDVSA